MRNETLRLSMENAQLRSQLEAQNMRLSMFANLMERLAIVCLDEDDYDETKREIAEALGREDELPDDEDAD